jgi:hypothetical protein
MPDVAVRWTEHERNTDLLDAELPSPRFVDARYLQWLYDQNPFGPAIEAAVDDEQGLRVAHYALIPQEYRDATGPARFYFSLNAVVRSGTQRRGYFSELGLRIWPEAADRGALGVIGVMNARSVTPVARLGWTILGALPVVVAAPSPVPPRGVESHDVDDAFLAGGAFERVTADLDEAPAEHWTNRCTTDYLRWRLASPNSGPFAVHADDDLFAVSLRTQHQGVPVAVILKLAPRGPRPRRRSAQHLVTAACHHHRAVAAVYAGWNRWVKVVGVRPPDRLKPSPLILGVCNVSDRVDGSVARLDTYEFLDMDAY